MDQDSYEMVQLTEEQLGDAKQYLLDGMKLEILYYKDEPLSVDLPTTVDLDVTYTEPGFKGDTATGGTKPADARDRAGRAGAALRHHRREDPRQDRHWHLR